MAFYLKILTIFFSELCDINWQLWEIKSELRDINSQFWLFRNCKFMYISQFWPFFAELHDINSQLHLKSSQLRVQFWGKKTSKNCEFVSHNSGLCVSKSEFKDINSEFWEKKSWCLVILTLYLAIVNLYHPILRERLNSDMYTRTCKNKVKNVRNIHSYLFYFLFSGGNKLS